MSQLSAYQYNFSISITIYTIWYGNQQIAKCTFYLRNLQGDTQEEQVRYIKEIVKQIVEELYYLTGFGIDKSVIKVGSVKVDEVVYPNSPPRVDKVRFKALLFRFNPPYRYEWVKDDQKKRFISESELTNGWQPKAVPSSYRDTESFRLPVVATPYRSETDDGYVSFFRHSEFLTKKRKRKPYGFRVTYNQKDPLFMRFIARFYEDGNLAFGEKGFFGSRGRHPEITGRDWPESKAKPEKQPRRSVLASRPTDNTDYVYFIQAGRTHLYKIGKSNDPQGRLVSLQTANPHKLKLLHTFKADNATAAEEGLHRLFHSKRIEGEWFKLTPEQKNIILSVQSFEKGHFWINDSAVDVDKLFDTQINVKR